MNLRDEEWEPAPTDPGVLSRVRAAVKTAVSPHDVSRLRTALLSSPCYGAIPHEVRGAVWMLLMGLRAEDLLAENASDFARAAREAVRSDNSSEQIEKDVDRTRPGLARFKQPAVRGALLRLLSLFCARHRIGYIQGLNELLAPFVLLADTGGNPRIVYALFSEFLSRFAPWMLDTSESRYFDVLKRAFKYFGRLLLYHDPQLSWMLEREMMTPDLYATSWFVTLFARNFTVETVLALWDMLLLEDNPLGTCFFGLALLLSKREELLKCDPSSLPERLMMLGVNSPEDVRKLWKTAAALREAHTPPSFQRLMTDRLLHAPVNTTQNSLLAARSMQAAVSLQTTPDDLTAGVARYFTWDCRTKEEYDAGHLARAAYLCLDALRAAGGDKDADDSVKLELEQAVALCEPLKGSSHICLVGAGIKEEDDIDVNVFALHLTTLGFPYVSTLRGGFLATVAAARDDEAIFSVELVDFDQSAHDVAVAKRISARRQRERQAKIDAAARADAEKLAKLQISQRIGQYSRASNPGTLHAEVHSGESDDIPSASIGDVCQPDVANADSDLGSGINRVLTGFGLRLPGLIGLGDSTSPAADSSTCTNPFSPNSSTSPSSIASEFGAHGSNESELNASSRTSGAASRPSDVPTPTAAAQKNMDRPEKLNPALISPEVSPHGVSKQESKSTSHNSSTESSPNEVLHRSRGPSKVASRLFGSKSPWGRHAKPGWLSDESLSLPLSEMPKGFTVNIMDDRVMAGLRLFPCRVRSAQKESTSPEKNVEFKRRYVGVSANYFMLLASQSNRSHLLEVKLIRYLQDIIRITFKRSRPELVTFEILSVPEENGEIERVVCLLPDGLNTCVDLIKSHLGSDDSENMSSSFSPAETPGCDQTQKSMENHKIVVPPSPPVFPVAVVPPSPPVYPDEAENEIPESGFDVRRQPTMMPLPFRASSVAANEASLPWADEKRQTSSVADLGVVPSYVDTCPLNPSSEFQDISSDSSVGESGNAHSLSKSVEAHCK